MKWWAAVIAAWLCCMGSALAASCTPANKPILLEGTVVRKMFFGPPNFGEDPRHDQRGFYPVLKTDRPVLMCAGSDPGFDLPSRPVSRMQMIFFNGFDHRFYGRHVKVRAKLFAWETAYHHTPVMLQVVRIEDEDVAVSPTRD